MSIFIIMSVALTFTLGTTFYGNTVERVKFSKKKEMTTLAIETTNKIERFLFERSADIKVFAESQILTMPEVADDTRLNYLKNVVNAYQTYDNVFVIDNSGSVRLSVVQDQEDQHYIKLMPQILSGTLYVSDFVYFSDVKQYFIYFSEPIYDSDKKSAWRCY